MDVECIKTAIASKLSEEVYNEFLKVYMVTVGSNNMMTSRNIFQTNLKFTTMILELQEVQN